MASNLVQRVGFAMVAIPLAVLVVWLGGWPLAGLVSLVAVLGAREVFDLASRQGTRPLRITGMIAAGAVPAAAYAFLTDTGVAAWVSEWGAYIPAAVLIGWMLAVLLVRGAGDRPMASIAITLFAVSYAAVLPAFLLGIRHAEFGARSWAGAALVFFPMVVIWICDTAAMFAGKAIGGPKLAPAISPGKTRSGGVAGILGGLAVAPLFSLLVFPRVGVSLSLGAALGIALVLSLLGQLGDLVESLLKREAGVKDSSALIPGHGGVLDRFDALYVALPVAAICYKLLGLL